ncbi:hypothetical protein B0H11DRAFT_1989879 [Mycena galericulata]|nr:hypothetical protein B0H11DRAFT_1989879 [Mycena galericulata]
MCRPHPPLLALSLPPYFSFSSAADSNGGASSALQRRRTSPRHSSSHSTPRASEGVRSHLGCNTVGRTCTHNCRSSTTAPPNTRPRARTRNWHRRRMSRRGRR